MDTREEDYRGKEPVTSQRPSRAGVTLSGTDSTKEADPGEGSREAQQWPMEGTGRPPGRQTRSQSERAT